MMSFSQIINDFIQSFSSINLGGNFKEIVTNNSHFNRSPNNISFTYKG